MLVVFIPLLLLLAVAGSYRIMRYNQELATLEWPTCDGQIVESRTEIYSWRKRSVTPIVAYIYQVNGGQFVGRRIRLHDDRAGRKDDIDDLLKDYPVGGKVAVHYDPEAPANSCLRPGPIHENVSLYHMAIGMLILSMTCALIWLLFPRAVMWALVKLGRDISK